MLLDLHLKRVSNTVKSQMLFEALEKIYEGDNVKICGFKRGKVVFECGAFGIAFNDIDYNVIQQKMDEDSNCCGNTYYGCFNDNFVSLWELYWNFNCEENSMRIIEVIYGEEKIKTKFRGRNIVNDEFIYGTHSKELEQGDNGAPEHLFKEINTLIHYIKDEKTGYEMIVFPDSVERYEESLDAYEGDLLIYESEFDKWKGKLKFNKEFDSMMVFDLEDEEWYEIEEYEYSRIEHIDGR